MKGSEQSGEAEGSSRYLHSLDIPTRMMLRKSTCLLCNDDDETLSHFLLFCKSLETVRKLILGDVCHKLSEAVKIDFTP